VDRGERETTGSGAAVPAGRKDRRLRRWGLLLGLVVLVSASCAGVPPYGGAASDLQPGRYVQRVYRSPDFNPAALTYQLEPLPVTFSQGLSPQEAADLFNTVLVQTMQANGLQIAAKPGAAVLTGQVERFTVASPAWRFLSGRGQVQIQARGEIRQGQEVVFAFQDWVKINPAVNPRHQPGLERDLLAQQAARRLAMNLLNEMLLPPRPEPPDATPAGKPPELPRGE
jgi:hypothetical protein